MKVMVDSNISSEEKGHANSLTPEGAREELDRKYSRNEGVDRCVLAMFGFGVGYHEGELIYMNIIYTGY